MIKLARGHSMIGRARLTKSLTILPSSLATAMLRTVLSTRNMLCSATTPTSLLRHPGNATLKRIAESCLKNDRSMLGLDLAVPVRSGKKGASERSLEAGVGVIAICGGKGVSVTSTCR